MHINRLLLLAAASVALLLSLAVIFAQPAATPIAPEIVAAAAADPTVQAAIANSETTAVAQQMPIERLAGALIDAPQPANADAAKVAEIEPVVAANIAAGLLVATDRMWMVKEWADGGYFERSDLSAWADYWIAIWPDLDRHIASGAITRVVRPVKKDADGKVNEGMIGYCIVNNLKKKGMRCTVNTDQWCVELTFHPDRAPLPALFALAREIR